MLPCDFGGPHLPSPGTLRFPGMGAVSGTRVALGTRAVLVGPMKAAGARDQELQPGSAPWGMSGSRHPHQGDVLGSSRGAASPVHGAVMVAQQFVEPLHPVPPLPKLGCTIPRWPSPVGPARMGYEVCAGREVVGLGKAVQVVQGTVIAGSASWMRGLLHGGGLHRWMVCASGGPRLNPTWLLLHPTVPQLVLVGLPQWGIDVGSQGLPVGVRGRKTSRGRWGSPQTAAVGVEESE